MSGFGEAARRGGGDRDRTARRCIVFGEKREQRRVIERCGVRLAEPMIEPPSDGPTISTSVDTFLRHARNAHVKVIVVRRAVTGLM